MILNPTLLPKLRSKLLTDACGEMPCTGRLMSFLGLPCASHETVVGAHLPIFGKGTGTKVSDMAIAGLCDHCHALLDLRDKRGVLLMESPDFWVQVMKANHETIARWIMAEVLPLPRDGRLI